MVASTTVNWITGEISIVRADLPIRQASPEVRTLDVDALRLKLRDLEDDEAGRPWPRTHDHNTEVTLSGITYARLFNILDPYFITFEDGQYGVVAEGANNNILDVKTANQVSLLGVASAGNTVPPLTATTVIEGTETLVETLRIIRAAVAGTSTFVAGVWRFFSRDDAKARITATVNTTTGERDSVSTDGSE